MEARTTLRGKDVSNRIVAVVAVMALGAGAAVLAKDITGSIAGPSAHFAQVKSGVSDPGSAWNYTVRRGGTQSVEGPAAPTSNGRPTFRESHGY